MCPSILVFTSSLNTAVLHRIKIVKWVNACPKIILDAGSVADAKRQSSGLLSHLTWISSPFLSYLKTKVYASTVAIIETLWRRTQQFENEVNNTPRIFERLRVSFSSRAQMCVREHGGHFEHLLYVRKMKEVANSSFVCFLLMYNPLHLRST
jgi:hypothetical protein